MEEWYLGKLLSLWPFELPHVVLFYLKIVCKCNWWCCYHFTTICIVESFNNKHVSSLFFTNYSLPFCLCWTPLLWLFWNFFHFGVAKKGLKFKVSYPMFFLFICSFCNFRWWDHNHLVIPNIIASFISDLF